MHKLRQKKNLLAVWGRASARRIGGTQSREVRKRSDERAVG